MTDKGFKTGILMLLKQVANLLILIFQAHLKKAPGVKGLQNESNKLSFQVTSRKEDFSVTVEDLISSVQLGDESACTGDVIRISFGESLPELSHLQQTVTVADSKSIRIPFSSPDPQRFCILSHVAQIQ